MPFSHLVLCHPLLLLPSIFPSIMVFSKESVLHIRWPKYWSLFSFSISLANEFSGLISFRIDWFDFLAVQGTLKCLKHRIAEGLRDYYSTRIDWNVLTDIRFLRIALIPVALHLVWNTNWLASFGLLRFLVLGIIAWAVALRLVQAGLRQIREEKCSRGLPL